MEDGGIRSKVRSRIKCHGLAEPRELQTQVTLSQIMRVKKRQAVKVKECCSCCQPPEVKSQARFFVFGGLSERAARAAAPLQAGSLRGAADDAKKHRHVPLAVEERLQIR